MSRVAFFVAVIALVVVMSGCGDSRSFETRKSRLMFDCQCEPGTNEYSYKLAGLLIEEQVVAKKYVENNKSKFLECTGIKESEYKMLVKHIDEQISFNKKARPYFLTKLFFGESQVRDITGYKEVKFDLLVKSLEDACSKTAARDAAINSAGDGAALPSIAKAESAQSAAADADGSKSQAPLKLSLAAERAIREGFVDITNPDVQACTDKRIEVIRKQIGEEFPINFEVFNEAAVACGFNI